MSLLHELTQHVTAADLRVPFGPNLDESMDCEDALELVDVIDDAWRPYSRSGQAPIARACLVMGDNKPVGFVFGTDLASGQTVGDVARPLRVECVVSDSTPALQLVRRWSSMKDPWALVLGPAGLTGSVSCAEMLRPEFAQCVFGFLLEVEQRIAEHVANDLDVSTIWTGLECKTKSKALKEFRKRYQMDADVGKKQDLAQLVFCTIFADMPTLLVASPLFGEWNHDELKNDMKLMRKWRNDLAHTRVDVGRNLKELNQVLDAGEKILQRLEPPPSFPLQLID